jgi:general nucleoside transport system permease protein
MMRISVSRSTVLAIAIPMIAVALALATAAILLAVTGANPWTAYQSMFSAALGSVYSLSTTVVKSVPRLLPALGIAIALRAGLWNIGAEGQIYVGAVAATAVTMFGPNLGFPGNVLLALLGGMLGGALWGAIPGVLRAYRGISEVITSLMLVYVGIQLTNYLLEGPWLVEGSTFPATSPIASSARLPVWEGTLFNAGVLVALLGVVGAGFLVSRTTFGLRIRALGGNERAAAVAGVAVGPTIVLVLAVSGAFAGLAGAVEVLGARGRLIEGFSPGYGFEAIAIALLGRLSPWGIVAGALLFGALDAGGAGLATAAQGAPSAIVPIVASLSVIYVLAGLGIVERLARRRRASEALAASQADTAQPSGQVVTPS